MRLKNSNIWPYLIILAGSTYNGVFSTNSDKSIGPTKILHNHTFKICLNRNHMHKCIIKYSSKLNLAANTVKTSLKQMKLKYHENLMDDFVDQTLYCPNIRQYISEFSIGCQIPNIPNVIIYRRDKKFGNILPPNSSVEHNEFITYGCADRRHKLLNNPFENFCFNDEWSNEHPKCESI